MYNINLFKKDNINPNDYGLIIDDLNSINNLLSKHNYINSKLLINTCKYLFDYIGAFLIIETFNNNLYIHIVVNKNIQITDNCRVLKMTDNTYYHQISYYNDILYEFYNRLIMVKKIKDMFIIQNFGDFPVHRLDNLHPKHLWKKDIIINKPKILDIYSYCKNKNYCDQLIPSPDVLSFSFKKYNYGNQNFYLDWDNKIDKLIFRGSNSSGYLKENNPREILCKLSLQNSNLIDCKIVSDFNYPILLDNKDTIEFIEHQVSNKSEYLNLIQQSNYKYQIHIDGFVAAWRLVALLHMNCLIFRVESEWYEYYYEHLKPWIHYIPIKKDLTDLIEKINWCLNNDDKCKIIAKNAYCFAIDNLNMEKIINYTYDKLKIYIKNVS